jgi:hypothetical protein
MISYAANESTLMFGLVTVIWREPPTRTDTTRGRHRVQPAVGQPAPSETDHAACHRRPVSTYPHLRRPNTIRALTNAGNAPQPCLRNNTREQQHPAKWAIYQRPQPIILPPRQAPVPASRMRSGKQVRFRRTNP